LPTTELRKVLKSELTERFECRGFKKRSRLAFTLALAPDMTGRFTCTTSKARPGSVAIFPLVGVRFEPAQVIVDRVLGYPPRLRNVSVQTGLIYLVPGRLPRAGVWEFPPDAVARAAVVDDLMETIDRFALPYMHSLADPRLLLERLVGSDKPDARYMAGVVSWALGDASAGLECLRQLVLTAASAEAGSSADYFGRAASDTMRILQSDSTSRPA
jgi:hypothetical protein